MSEINIIKQKILIASRILYAPNGITEVQEGFTGHVSCRLPEGDNYIVTGHTHLEGRSTLGDIEYEDLVKVDLKTGERLDGTQPLLGENTIHTGIYRARNEVTSVIHVHPFWCTIWSLVENPSLGLPVYFTGKSQIESEEEGEKLGTTLGNDSAVLLPGHGIVTVGKTIEEACIITASINEQAKKLWYATLLGKIPQKYLELIMRPPRTSIEGDTWRWYMAKIREKGLYPKLP